MSKTWYITGSSRGLGRAWALAALQLGAVEELTEAEARYRKRRPCDGLIRGIPQNRP